MLSQTIKGLFTCDTCQWNDQCHSDYICDLFDSIEEAEIDRENQIIQQMEHHVYQNAWEEYCKEATI
ncbi:MAG: hypothetical protein HFE73_05225 [Firmicutes bacterium]|nr:hypothetical protein [Bacillota bacterium]